MSIENALMLPVKKVLYLLFIALSVSGLVIFFILGNNSPAFLFGTSGPIVAAEADSMSYVPGYGANPLSTNRQFERFPLPQFFKQNLLNANFLWMDPSFLGGSGQDGVSPSQAVQNSVYIQEQLARYWNYSIMVNNNTKIFNKYKDEGSFVNSWVKLANDHPEWPAAAITFWGQVRPRHLNDSSCGGDRGYIARTNMADSMYLHFEPGANNKTKRINPAIHPGNFDCDGRTQQKYISELLNALKRPLNYINENGEVFHLIESARLERDARVIADKKKYPELNTYQYQSQKRLILENNYKNYFLTDPRLKDTKYSVYAIDGFEKYRHDYGIMRNVQSSIRGMKYSTPDFYPRWPNNWRKMQGPWHGLEWIEICRDREISFGDHLFSPFVAAGWDKDERVNIPPGQWLGLLKILHVFGAEFFYTGYFNEKMPPNDPRNYCWQSVMPGYAQAVFSYYPEVLLEGRTQKEKEWFLESNRSDVVAIVRKHKDKEQYLMAVSLQHNTNDRSNAHEVDAIIQWKGREIHLKAREQGSVYLLDLSNLAQSKVLFLDEWHSWMHPVRWEKEHWMDAGITHPIASLKSEFPIEGEVWDLRKLNNCIVVMAGEQYQFQWQKRTNEKLEELILDVQQCEPGAIIELFSGNDSMGSFTIKPGENSLKVKTKGLQYTELKLTLQVKSGRMDLKRWKVKCSRI